MNIDRENNNPVDYDFDASASREHFNAAVDQLTTYERTDIVSSVKNGIKTTVELSTAGAIAVAGASEVNAGSNVNDEVLNALNSRDNVAYVAENDVSSNIIYQVEQSDEVEPEPSETPLRVAENSADIEEELVTPVTRAELGAEYQEALEQLPTNTFRIENNHATPTNVDSQNFAFNNRGELVAYSEDRTETLIWNERAGWLIPQFETATTRVLLDHDFTQHTEDSDYYEEQWDVLSQSYIYSIRTSTQSDIEHFSQFDNYYWLDTEQTPGTRDFILQTRDMTNEDFEELGYIPNSPLVENPDNGAETIDTIIYAAFAMMYFDTDAPTDEQLLEIKNRATAGEELSVEISRDRTWNLGQRIDIVFSPYPSHRNQWEENGYGFYPPTPFDVNENGGGIIHITRPTLNSGQAATNIMYAFRPELTNQGIPTNAQGEYTSLNKIIFPISSDNRHIVLPLVIGEASAETGGRITERPTNKSNRITS